ncbi:VC_2705 family sodium/solute symporter [Oryzomicrobium sp.]|uniref:sodium:solute symporter family protein n=2 Tax=Pseudomonadota TaxID=1224 RepID=UPI0025D9889B|nr:VC_2705 family sodium/solute symporter [Oryzomicrobium sp.]MCE1242564.1 VC_2705 family sodium/solute symporter [Oryzomicrobium sp.]
MARGLMRWFGAIRGGAGFVPQLRRYYLAYTAGFILFVLALAGLEQMGMPPRWIGYAFLLFTILLYATIGILSRTSDVTEYYVAGRRVPAIFNGMATGADWMSAASFIGLAGMLFLSGFQGLAYVMGWTGGYVLVALLLAPYLRKFGQYTIPDFLAARYGGTLPRLVGVVAAILASFVYVVAQIYGVGLITSRFVGLQFEIGVFVGLAGILVCSFLGGMRAVTWTQVAQFVILIIAYLTPVCILGYKVSGSMVPPVAYGEAVQQVSRLEEQIFDLPAEKEARDLYRARADAIYERIVRLPDSLEEERARLTTRLNEMKANNALLRDIVAVEKERRELPRSPEEARVKWESQMREAADRGAQPIRHADAFEPRPGSDPGQARLNFLSLMFCLMIGTAALPHVLMRYYTTPTVQEARDSVFWSLLFILMLYIAAPAYAVYAKLEVFSSLINTPIIKLPSWVAAWGKVGLVHIEDINRDGLLQWAELSLNPDVIVLATPEIAGLPYVVSGLVAAGGLAAALSTADGLLLVITSALSHDVYYKIFRPQASTQWRLVVSKSLLLVVAICAATLAAQRPSTILYMVAWAFSIAGAAFFPALVMGIFWRRANRAGAVAGMLVGLGVTLYYMVRVQFDSIPWLGLHGIAMEPWFGIDSTAAGVWGVPLGFITIVVVSLLTPPPPPATQNVVTRIRYPRLEREGF